MIKTARILISGKVQGVFFRYEAKLMAARQKLAGRIRNTSDGGVEAIVQGEEESIRKFITWCRRGPPLAQVENISIEWFPDAPKFNSFEIT